MSAFFVDTSALVKRYINEVGSTWLINQVQRSSGNISVVSELASVEIFSAFARREREGIIPLRTLDAIQLSCAIYAMTMLNTPFTFIAADNNLLMAASAEGFTIDNPNLHP